MGNPFSGIPVPGTSYSSNLGPVNSWKTKGATVRQGELRNQEVILGYDIAFAQSRARTDDIAISTSLAYQHLLFKESEGSQAHDWQSALHSASLVQ